MNVSEGCFAGCYFRRQNSKTQMIHLNLMLLVNLEVAGGISMSTTCCEHSRSLPKNELHSSVSRSVVHKL